MSSSRAASTATILNSPSHDAAEADVFKAMTTPVPSLRDYANGIYDAFYAYGRVLGDENHEIMKGAFIVRNVKAAFLGHVKRNVFDGEVPQSEADFLTDLAEKALQTGYDSAERVVRQRTEEAQRNYLDGLAEKYEETIWALSERGKTLIEPMVAQAVQQEMQLMALEQGGRPRFLRYDSTRAHWIPVSNLTIERLIRYIIGNTSTRINASKLRSISTIVAQDVLLDEDTGKSDNVINLANGVFDLTTYQLLPHDPKYGLTYRNNYVYDESARCPTFDEQLLLYAQFDPEWIASFWEIVGASLTSENPYQKMFWFLGSGANGKGTVLRILTELVGRQMTLSGFGWDKLGGDYFLGSIIGKRLAVCGDADKEMKNAHALKQLTGGDRMVTNVKYGDYTDVDVKAKIIIALNRMPRIDAGESLYAIERRIQLLPFDYTITTPDPDMDNKLLQELPGIFNRAIDGLRRLRKQGNRFTVVHRGQRRVQGWLKTLNMFQSFVSERCVVEKGTGTGIYGYALWADYEQYMDSFAEPNWKANPRYITNSKTFTTRVREDFGLEVTERHVNDGSRRGSYTYLFGIRLLNQADIDERIMRAKADYEKIVGKHDDQAPAMEGLPVESAADPQLFDVRF